MELEKNLYKESIDKASKCKKEVDNLEKAPDAKVKGRPMQLMTRRGKLMVPTTGSRNLKRS